MEPIYFRLCMINNSLTAMQAKNVAAHSAEAAYFFNGSTLKHVHELKGCNIRMREVRLKSS